MSEASAARYKRMIFVGRLKSVLARLFPPIAATAARSYDERM